ncbi:DUF4349 domain-containing protein [Candidatus Laterigemmans baculatus]|uniref:DUF4349 domain-containing protein n=1 Tax=Candidatus Laterigemmans baculatus TaxID=2770505 RepID=UPI0013DBF015|nr:DUF4349 domain-containing protein [Candidatus Laterigemmans baculatus]
MLRPLFSPALLASLWVVSLLGVSLLGCGAEQESASRVGFERDTQSAADSAAPGEAASQSEGATDGSDSAAAAQQARRIIYDTRLSLVVEDYQDFETQIVRLVEEYGGFVAHSETNRRFRDRQSGTWTVRVPVDAYSEFLTGVTSLGFAESRRENAQDVTEEFVDIEARIGNKRELEQRILTMLEERTGKLTDVLEIERELSRVREEIERMEGRLRYLSDRTSLATITIDCREEQEYTPPAAPTFASRVTRAWNGSLELLRIVSENLLVVLVAVAPWLLVAALPALLVWVIVRRRRRRV